MHNLKAGAFRIYTINYTRGSASKITTWGILLSWDENRDNQSEIHPRNLWFGVRSSEFRPSFYLGRSKSDSSLSSDFLCETEIHLLEFIAKLQGSQATVSIHSKEERTSTSKEYSFPLFSNTILTALRIPREILWSWDVSLSTSRLKEKERLVLKAV